MSAAVRLGAVVAVVVTFGITAVLAIALTRGAPLRASLVSDSRDGRHHAVSVLRGRHEPPVFTRSAVGENGNHDPQRDRDHARRLASPVTE